MTPVVRSRRLQAITLATDLPLAIVATVLAFALDVQGGVGHFLFSSGLFFVAFSPVVWFSVRALNRGKGVAPLPADAVIRGDSELRRRVLRRLLPWAAFVAVVIAALGTSGAGMLVGTNVGSLLSFVVMRRWEDGRNIELFSPEKSRWIWWGQHKEDPWAFTQARAAGRATA